MGPRPRGTLVLTEGEVRGLLRMEEVMEAVELAFREKGLGRAQMPAKLYLFYERHGGDLRTMPSYLEALDISAVKVVNAHPDNRTKRGLPTVMAIIILIEPESGFPLAVMGGTAITAFRTGAAGGIAAKYLAKRGPHTIALVGAGAQARTQLLALLALYGRLGEVRIWGWPADTRDAFLAEMGPLCEGRAELTPADDLRRAVENADIIVTATPSRKPLVADGWVSEGAHINCIGADAPGKQELDPAILRRARIVVDDWEQASHSGEINVPISKGLLGKGDVWAELGEIVAGLKPGRESDREVTVFVSTGLAIQDAVTANLVYRKALERGLGRLLHLVV
ncbi:MAG: alanine dehydrogenase [Candidatus Bathyarchaeia archaeon]